jgi:outer membrane protein assembly factor BamB
MATAFTFMSPVSGFTHTICRANRFGTDRSVPDDYPAQMPKSGWATPFIWKNELRTEIVTISPGVAISYDAQGQELWRVAGVTGAPSSSSFAYDGLLYLDGGKTKPIFAIRPGAAGDITPDSSGETVFDENDFIVWSQPRTGTYIPTPVAYQGGLYVVHDNGIVVRLDAKTGEETFKARIRSESGADFTSSPWAYNGKVFCVSEQGDTYVIEASEEYKLLGVNPLDDLVMSTPAIINDRLILRTAKRLYSIRRNS